MGKSIDQHELIADYLDEMQSDLEGIRALTMHGTLNEEMGQRIGMMLDFELISEPEERERLQQERAILRERARRATPLAKYLATEKAVEMARRCVQIHGGVGYTTEYGAEKLLELGVAWRVVADERLLEEARDVAMRLSALPPTAVSMMKQVLNNCASIDLEKALQLETRATVKSFLDPETTKRMKSF